MLNVLRTVSVVPTRNAAPDGFSDDDWQPIAAVDVLYFLDPPAVTPEKGKSYTQMGRLYVSRDADIEDGDRIPLQEGMFGVVGPAGLNQDHAITGTDFGWKKYVIRLGG